MYICKVTCIYIYIYMWILIHINHWHNGHKFEQGPGVGDGQGSLACGSPWGRKESDMTEQLNWTELNSNKSSRVQLHFSDISDLIDPWTLGKPNSYSDLNKYCSPQQIFIIELLHMSDMTMYKTFPLSRWPYSKRKQITSLWCTLVEYAASVRRAERRVTKSSVVRGVRWWIRWWEG